MKKWKGVDPITTIIPLALILLLCISFVIAPEYSTDFLGILRGGGWEMIWAHTI